MISLLLFTAAKWGPAIKMEKNVMTVTKIITTAEQLPNLIY